MEHDLTSPGFLTDPGPTLAAMQAEGALVKRRIPLLGQIWCATTDAACRDLLKSPDLFRRDGGGRPLARRYWWLPPFMKPLLANMLAADGADHARLRGLVDQAFARHTVADLRPDLTRIADDLLDRLDPAAPVDLRAAYARPLPLSAICALLGIPADDRDRITRWIAPISGPTSALTMMRALPGFRSLLRYFRDQFRALREDPRPGLISSLVHAQEDGTRLTEEELLAMVVTLFIAGHETTVHLIADAALTLLTDDAARERLRDDPAALPLMVEEVMRFFSPVMMTKPLYAVRDTVFHGQPLKTGEAVLALLIAANHDPARHDTPEALIPDRRPNAHLGFGHGPHVCLGMQLARAEAEIALSRLFTRFPQARLADPSAPIPWSRRTGVRGPDRLPVILSPAR